MSTTVVLRSTSKYVSSGWIRTGPHDITSHPLHDMHALFEEQLDSSLCPLCGSGCRGLQWHSRPKVVTSRVERLTPTTSPADTPVVFVSTIHAPLLRHSSRRVRCRPQAKEQRCAPAQGAAGGRGGIQRLGRARKQPRVLPAAPSLALGAALSWTLPADLDALPSRPPHHSRIPRLPARQTGGGNG